MESTDDKRRPSSSRRYGCLTIVLLLLTFVVVIPMLRGSGHPGIDHEIHEFPGVESDEDISIGVDADHDGVIHLAWSAAGLGLNYVSSPDFGNSWSKSVQVGDSTSVIDLFAKGDTIVVFSISDGPDIPLASRPRHGLESVTSMDGGRSWSEPRRLVDWINPRAVDLVKVGDHLYLAFCKDRVIYFMRGEDFGHTWSNAVEIGGLKGSAHPRTFAIAASASSISVSWVEMHHRKQGGSSRVPFLVEGSNRGLSWGKPTDLTAIFLDDHQGAIYGYGGGVVALDSTLFAYFGTQDAGMYGSFRSIRGARWSPARRMFAERSSYGRIEAVSHQNKVLLGIVGVRYREHDPIGYAFRPFRSAFSWRNNDLDLLTIAPGEDWQSRVITPAASRVTYGYKGRTKKLLVVGDKLVVFWSGRKKVGRTVDAFGFKEQIFWAKLDLQSLE